MRRKLNIPAAFLTALALGVWVGASWHSAAQPLSFTQSGATCSACCRLVAALSKSKTPQIDATNSSENPECAACLAGALVNDVP